MWQVTEISALHVKKIFQFKKFVNLLKVSQSASAVFLLRSNPVSKIYYCAYIIYFLTSLL